MTSQQRKGDSLTKQAVAAMRAAVDAVVRDHRQRGKPLIVWRDGKVVREMPASSRVVRESRTAYPAGTENTARDED